MLKVKLSKTSTEMSKNLSFWRWSLNYFLSRKTTLLMQKVLPSCKKHFLQRVIAAESILYRNNFLPREFPPNSNFCKKHFLQKVIAAESIFCRKHFLKKFFLLRSHSLLLKAFSAESISLTSIYQGGWGLGGITRFLRDCLLGQEWVSFDPKMIM